MQLDVEDLSPLRDGGNRREKPPSSSSQSSPGLSVAKIVTIFPCRWLRMLMKMACRRHPRPSVDRCPGSGLAAIARCRRLEGSRLLDFGPNIAAACPLGPSLRGSSTVSDACRQSLRDHKEAVFFLYDNLSPCMDAKLPQCRCLPVGPGRHLGRRVATIFVRCRATPHIVADDLLLAWQRLPAANRVAVLLLQLF